VKGPVFKSQCYQERKKLSSLGSETNIEEKKAKRR
jgi:hypothetical protein